MDIHLKGLQDGLQAQSLLFMYCSVKCTSSSDILENVEDVFGM